MDYYIHIVILLIIILYGLLFFKLMHGLFNHYNSVLQISIENVLFFRKY